MGMAADQFAGDGFDHAAEVEQPDLLRDPRVEDDLQQQVAQLVPQLLSISALNGVGDFVGLLDRERGDCRERLFEIPGTAPAGREARP